jgi:beta-lactamase class D
MNKLISFFLFITNFAYAVDFGKRDACYIIAQAKDGKVIAQSNEKRCQERFPPCSTLKPIIALMAFEKGLLKDETSIIKWDGTRYSRAELNDNQTPITWMKFSVNWANDKIIAQLGRPTVENFLQKWFYGNHDFSKGEGFMVPDALLKISSVEQINLFRNIWNKKLVASPQNMDLIKKILFIENLEKQSKLYGKTGSCCLDHNCEQKAGRQFGWFVGVLENGENKYAFALNFSDLVPSRGYAGAEARDLTKKILKEKNLIK